MRTAYDYLLDYVCDPGSLNKRSANAAGWTNEELDYYLVNEDCLLELIANN